MNVQERYTRFKEEVQQELQNCGRTDNVTIVAVTKKQPIDVIIEALNAGVTDIGENYVQEAQKKFEVLRNHELGSVEERCDERGAAQDAHDRSERGFSARAYEQEHCTEAERREFPRLTLARDFATLRKHFIGHIQTNKAKAIVETFDMVQSIDRLEAGEALARAARAAGKHLPILLQINISLSERFGIAPEEAPQLADSLHSLGNLTVEGVMAIGPLTGDRAEIQRAFALAAKTFGQVGGSTLSIGMSGDWREAIRAGSTMIRIGTAIFGARGPA